MVQKRVIPNWNKKWIRHVVGSWQDASQLSYRDESTQAMPDFAQPSPAFAQKFVQLAAHDSHCHSTSITKDSCINSAGLQAHRQHHSPKSCTVLLH